MTTPNGFRRIYEVFRNNLRDSLARAQDFAQWLRTEYLDEGNEVPGEVERGVLLDNWLLQQGRAAHQAALSIQPRAWRLFNDIARAAGRAGSAAYEEFGYPNQQQMSGNITQLAAVNLVVRERDPEDASRTINVITAEGWLVKHFLDQEQ